jgi:C1A family cysteine protease
MGYYEDNQKRYYIGKNSWGTAWGEQGFVKIDASVQ